MMILLQERSGHRTILISTALISGLAQCAKSNEGENSESDPAAEMCVSWYRQIDRCADNELGDLDDDEVLEGAGDCVEVLECLEDRWSGDCISAMRSFHDCYYDLDCGQFEPEHIVFAFEGLQVEGDPCYAELDTYLGCFDTDEELDEMEECVLIVEAR